MRFAPGQSLDVVFIAGLGARPAAPMVTVARADGREVRMAPGHSPGWTSDGQVVWCPPEDGVVQQARLFRPIGANDAMGPFAPQLPAGNTLTAAAGKVAVHRTDPRRVLTSWRGEIPGATDPVLSADGEWLAYLIPDRPLEGMSSVSVVRSSLIGTPLDYARIVWSGAPTRPRFSHTGTSLCWEGGYGAIFGIADVANPSSPVVKLSRPTDRLYAPVPLWSAERGELFVLAVQDRGDHGVLMLAEWGSAVAQAPVGYVLVPSSGSAYDHDVCVADARYAMVALLTPEGTLRRVTADFYAAHVPLHIPPTPEPPPPDQLPDWSFVPDGTLVTDAFRFMFGANPPTSADGKRICLHKNVNEQEWREVNDRDAYHLFDRSRYPGDVGWYLVGNVGWSGGGPLWASNRFASGNSFGWDGEIVEMSNGRRNRWTHRNTLYGLAAGGVCVQFDPRFQRQDYGPEKCYERQFSRADGRIRWELWFSPETARALPCGDRSLDVLKQAVEAQSDPNATPLPYLECPRLSVDDDPARPVHPPDPEPTMSLPDDSQMLNAMRRIHVEGYIGELRRAGGIFETPDGSSEIRDPRLSKTSIDDRSLSVWTGRYVRYFSDNPSAPGGPHEFAIRRVLTDLHNSDEARTKRGENTTPPPSAFSGPISVEGKGFVVPE